MSDPIPLVSFSLEDASRLFERCFKDALGLIRKRILDGRLELCISPEVAMSGTHDAVFRLHMLPQSVNLEDGPALRTVDCKSG